MSQLYQWKLPSWDGAGAPGGASKARARRGERPGLVAAQRRRLI
jgi:hypothetical protein